MEVLTFFNCKDLIEAKKKEQEYFVELKATLNSVEPMGNKKIKEEGEEYKICDLIEYSNSALKTKRFMCVKCNYNCNKESDYKKHMLTLKHKNTNTLTQNLQCVKHKCKCGKLYTFRQGLNIHKKTCTMKEDKQDDLYTNDIKFDNNNIITQLIKDNTEFKKISLDLIKSNTDMQKLLAEVINKIT
jgi:hypothetical protein